MGVSVLEVASGRDGRFEALPAPIRSAGHPAWTPRLPGEEQRLFDPRLNPSLEGIAYARWIALRDGRPVGRLAGFAPAAPADIGYFGYFEAPDDPAVAVPLLRAAEGWLANLGRSTVWGPIAVTPRDQIGLLVDGFDRPATLLTPWNPPHHARLLEAAGYVAGIRLRSYAWTPDVADRRGVRTLATRLGERGGIRIRSLDPRALPHETNLIVALINRAFAGTWGFPPITPPEADDLARQLRPILDPGIVLIAEDADGPCAVALSLPDANWLVRAIGGRLWPLGWLRALRLRRRIPGLRLMALAVLPHRRSAGLLARLMAASHRAWIERGYRYAELGQVFDDNTAMRRVLDRMGLPVVRRFAVFTRTLPGVDA